MTNRTPERLKTRAEFLCVAAARHKSARPGLVLQAARRPAGTASGDNRIVPPWRVGYTVSRKVGNAVARNRARRRLRAAVGRVMPDHALNGVDYVVIGRAVTCDRPFSQLVGDLESAMKRLHVWSDERANAGD